MDIDYDIDDPELEEDVKRIIDSLSKYVEIIDSFVITNSVKQASIDSINKKLEKGRKDWRKFLKYINYDEYLKCKQNGTLFINSNEEDQLPFQ